MDIVHRLMHQIELDISGSYTFPVFMWKMDDGQSQ